MMGEPQIGDAIWILWEDKKTFYKGKIHSQKGVKSLIYYEDGDKIWETLKDVTYFLGCKKNEKCSRKHRHVGKCNHNHLIELVQPSVTKQSFSEKSSTRKRKRYAEDAEKDDGSVKESEKKEENHAFNDKLLILEKKLKMFKGEMGEKDKKITSLQQKLNDESKTRDNAISLLQSKNNLLMTQISHQQQRLNSLYGMLQSHMFQSHMFQSSMVSQ